MATNIKDRCPPWKNDPGKSFLTLREVVASAAYEAIDGFYFPRKIHVTNLRLVCTEAHSVGATVGFSIKKGTTAVLSCPLTKASVSAAAVGDSFKGTETEIEFLTTDEMTVYVSKITGKTDGKYIPIIEYEQA